MKHKKCNECNCVVEIQCECCPDCGYDEFSEVNSGLIKNSSRMKLMLESVYLGGSMNGWSSEMLDEIDKVISDSSK